MLKAKNSNSCGVLQLKWNFWRVGENVGRGALTKVPSVGRV